MKRVRLVIVLSLILHGAWSGTALADRRVALVIGNSAYRSTEALANPKRDALALADVLRRLGFETDVFTDLDRVGMDRALRSFNARLEGADAALFFYAGHGIQADGVNFLIPVDARLASLRDVDYETVDMRLVLKSMDRGTGINLIFLDACRNNPLARNLAVRGQSAVSQGLAPMEASVGTVISYATKDGSVAYDGKGSHSPYAEALLRNIATPGLEVGIMLRRVRRDVIASTNGQQVPWDYGSLVGEFYMSGRPDPLTAASTPALDRDTVFWQSIQESGAAADFEAYLSNFPQGQFAALARSRLQKLREQTAGAAFTRPPANPAAVPAPAPMAQAAPAENAIYILRRAVSFRKEPSPDADELAQLRPDQVVMPAGRVDQPWVRVNVDGTFGWVRSRSLAEVDRTEFAAWQRVADEERPQPFEEFLRAHPRGYFATRVKGILAQFSSPAKPASEARVQEAARQRERPSPSEGSSDGPPVAAYDEKTLLQAEQDARNGSVHAMRDAGWLWEQGWFSDSSGNAGRSRNADREKAIRWYKMAAYRGERWSANRVGILLKEGGSTSEADKWFSLARQLALSPNGSADPAAPPAR